MKTPLYTALDKLAIQDNIVMRRLQLKEIRHVLCGSEKGELVLKLTKDGTSKDYNLLLDAVEYNKKDTNEILEMVAYLIQGL